MNGPVEAGTYSFRIGKVVAPAPPVISGRPVIAVVMPGTMGRTAISSDGVLRSASARTGTATSPATAG